MQPFRLPSLRRLLLIVSVAIAPNSASGDEPESPLRIEDSIPYGQPPIDYHADDARDPVAKLADAIAAGDVELVHEETTGYLTSLLRALDVPVSSQMLVFSKTALNVRLINPQTPRAVYFNDDVYVGWVPRTKSIEISADDPLKGGTFYTLSQDPDRPIRFEREARCLACHAGSTTLKVPGHLARSFLVDDKGRPQSGYSRITHDTALEKRFGGWFVTGHFGESTHMGNLRSPAEVERRASDPHFRVSVTDLAPLVDLSTYPSQHSDAVAHLVLHHQLHGRNLITRLAYETRLGKRSDVEDRLLRYLFFVDEPRFESPVRGSTDYAEWFESRGAKDDRGRSLRQLNLETRLFEHRLSYLVLSESFNELPEIARQRVWKRIDTVLAGENPTPEFERIPTAERRAIREILMAARSDP